MLVYISGGYLLGGGIGYRSRQLGVLSDNLKEIEMVNYKGDIIVANAEQNSDLYWASRGGGGGQFGVVTSVQLQTFKSEDRVVFYKLSWSNKQFSKVFQWWQITFATAPPEIGSMLKISSGKTLRIAGFSSASIQQFWNWLNQSLLNSTLPPPISSTIKTVSYIESLLLSSPTESSVSNVENLLVDISPAASWKGLSMYAYKSISESTLQMFYEHLKNSSDCKIYVLFKALGGVMDDIQATDTAYPHRKALTLAHLQYRWHRKTIRNPKVQTCLDKLNTAKTILMREFEGAYQNYADGDLENYMDAYYGPNVERLIRVKTKYDPENTFHFQQSICITKSQSET